MHFAVCDNCSLLRLRAWSTGQPWALRADAGSGHFLPVSVDEWWCDGNPTPPPGISDGGTRAPRDALVQ